MLSYARGLCLEGFFSLFMIAPLVALLGAMVRVLCLVETHPLCYLLLRMYHRFLSWMILSLRLVTSILGGGTLIDGGSCVGTFPVGAGVGVGLGLGHTDGVGCVVTISIAALRFYEY